MVKRSGEKIVKERVSIVVSREARKHLSFIALERELSTPGEAVDFILSYFDRSGRLKRQRDMIDPGDRIPLPTDAGERDYIPPGGQ